MKSTKATAIVIIITGVLIGGSIILSQTRGATNKVAVVQKVVEEYKNNVSVLDGKQIIEIRAKGGYQPRVSTAKAGIPTTIRFNTNGTFDCSSDVKIPSLGINRVLPQSGSTDIDVGSQKVATLQGTCGMGMYPFEIIFN